MRAPAVGPDGLEERGQVSDGEQGVTLGEQTETVEDVSAVKSRIEVEWCGVGKLVVRLWSGLAVQPGTHRKYPATGLRGSALVILPNSFNSLLASSLLCFIAHLVLCALGKSAQ